MCIEICYIFSKGISLCFTLARGCVLKLTTALLSTENAVSPSQEGVYWNTPHAQWFHGYASFTSQEGVYWNVFRYHASWQHKFHPRKRVCIEIFLTSSSMLISFCFTLARGCVLKFESWLKNPQRIYVSPSQEGVYWNMQFCFSQQLKAVFHPRKRVCIEIKLHCITADNDQFHPRKRVCIEIQSMGTA